MKWPWSKPEKRDAPLSFSEWLSYFSFNGNAYQVGLQQTLAGSGQEEIGGDFQGVVQRAFKGNSVVFACMLVRQLLFSEARFQFRQMRGGRPGDLFGSPELGVLEKPWPNGTTGDLLSRVMQDCDLAGNFYAYREFDQLYRMRPDWVRIILGSKSEPDDPAGAMDVEVVGYAYYHGGYVKNEKPTRVFMPQNVAHVAPIPDPAAHFRGMSWLTPILSEIMADEAMTLHKRKFMDQGATPNMVVKLDPKLGKAEYDEWVKALSEQSEGPQNAYKTLYLGGGADATIVGANFQQIDFKATQGAGETRIAAAAGVPPIIAGLSEGLAAGTYNNYGQAKRRLGDGTMRPLWRNMAGSFATIIRVPAASELWYDDRDIQWLQEDQKDAADVMVANASTIKQLVDAGYEAASVVQAVTSGDFTRLIHTGLFSVQLQPPGTVFTPAVNGTPPAPAITGANGQRDFRALLMPFTGEQEE